MKPGNHIITTAMAQADIHPGFMANLQAFAKETDATIHTIPMRYRNPKTREDGLDLKQKEWYDGRVVNLRKQHFSLNDNLEVLGNVSIQATRRHPLTGFESLTGKRSCIMGHGQIALQTVATPMSELPKIMTTTGACTVPQYNDSSSAMIAEHHHSLGAAFVEVADKDVFHLRQICAHRDGSFTHLDRHYANGVGSAAPRPAAMKLGDLHMETLDPDAWAATLDMIRTLKPETVVIDDVLDFSYKNHHDIKNFFKQYGYWHKGWTNVKDHLTAVCTGVEDLIGMKEIDRVVVTPSNHHDHLDMWLRDTNPHRDPENALIWCQLMAAKLQEIERQDLPWAAGRSAFELFFRHMYPHDGRVGRRIRWLQTDEPLNIEGVNAGGHGHLGPNGARGNVGNLSRLGDKEFFGHTHAPAIRMGAWWTGVLGILKPGYVKGPSSWLHTNGLIYRGGKRTLLNVIGKEWRRKYKLKL